MSRRHDPIAAPRRILLVDADAFFVAVARQTDPEGAGRARFLIVGGTPDGRGVVCSASYEARQFGVRSAMSAARAKRLCPQAMFVPVPRGVCSKKSREIAAVLARYSPVVQPASIDEWYVDLSGTEALYRGASLAEMAHRIRRDVLSETGLSVSLGGATNKLLAKLAVEFAKPKPGTTADGVFVVEPGDEQQFMARVALADIPMIGPRFRARLEVLGLRTVADVRALDHASLERLLGDRGAHWLYNRVRGIDDGTVVSRNRARSISHEETFHHDVGDDADLERELVRLVTLVASDLRRHALSARTINVKLRDGDFRTRRASRTLADAVGTDRVILATAHTLLARLRRQRRTPARLLGVALTGLGDADAETQLALFDEPAAGMTTETSRDRALASAVDQLRARYGHDAVLPGRLAGKKRAATSRPPHA